MATGADIETVHNTTHTQLRANIGERGVMAHNITFKRMIDPSMLTSQHSAQFPFRLPYLPSTGGGADNAQTIEAGLFIWDGQDTRLDYGTAYQWVLNPWMSSFGDVWSWSGANGGQWESATSLQPDTAWHTLSLSLDPILGASGAAIDGVQTPSAFSATPKSGWGSEVAARLQIEIISIWPGTSAASAPPHRAEFKDWTWTIQEVAA